MTARDARPDDFVWVHDYHLMLVARELRAMGFAAKTGFFLHIPFPPLDLFLKLPWRFPILMGTARARSDRVPDGARSP